MLNNFSSKCIKMTKRCAFGTSYSITYFNSGIKVRPSLGKACTNLCHVFGFVISTPGQGQQLLTGLLKKMVRRSTSSKGVNKPTHTHTRGAQGTLSLSKNCTSRESVSPLSRLIRGFRNKYH